MVDSILEGNAWCRGVFAEEFFVWRNSFCLLWRPSTSQIEEKCLPQDNYVAYNVFNFEMKKYMLYTSCDTKSQVEKYVLWSHIGFANRLQAVTGGFEQNLVTTYDVLLNCRIEDGGCGAKNVEMEELLKALEILIISKFTSFSSRAWSKALKHIACYVLYNVILIHFF
jgi:predicted RNA-binding protein associated with RNAse of E/G family